jgi:hypothetical protein
MRQFVAPRLYDPAAPPSPSSLMIFPESPLPIASQGFQGLFKNLGLSTNPQLTEQYSRISMPRISNLANLCPQVLQIIGGNFRSKALFLQAIEHQ